MGSKCCLAKLAVICSKTSKFMKLEGRVVGDGLDRMKCKIVRLSDSRHGCSLHIDGSSAIRGMESLLFPDTGDGWRTDQHLPERRVCESFARLCVYDNTCLNDVSYSERRIARTCNTYGEQRRYRPKRHRRLNGKCGACRSHASADDDRKIVGIGMDLAV